MRSYFRCNLPTVFSFSSATRSAISQVMVACITAILVPGQIEGEGQGQGQGTGLMVGLRVRVRLGSVFHK